MVISEKQKKILGLLADGAFHSGTELAVLLGISRSAVWKHIISLSELGLRHWAVRGKGYRLEKPLELLTQPRIYAALSDNARSLISAFEIHDQINSTNSYLVERGQQQLPSGGICFAEYQTAGKGRRGRHWVSPYGSNIYVSILWRFQQGPARIAGLSLAIGVAVVRALKQHPIHDIGLKWPNDIYSHGKKLGGILIEVSGETEGPCTAVIGLGLNVFLPETEAESITQPWTDLTTITGLKSLCRNKLAGALLSHMLPVIAEFEETGIEAYLDEWREYDCLKGRPVTLFIGRQSVEGILEGIDDNGFLLLKQADGTVQAFASGEVSFHPSSL